MNGYGCYEDVYGGKFYQKFRDLLTFSIKYRVLFMGAMVGLLLLSVLGFRYVPVLFFPESSRLQVMIDYWEPEGNRIELVASNLQGIEDKLLTLPQVDSVSSFIGQGPPRFYLPVNPETPHSSYAQLIVNTKTLDDVDTVIADITPWFAENYPDAFIRVRKYPVGSFDDWKFEARFSGSATADPEILRSLADQGLAILEQSPYTLEARSNWRQRVKKVVPEYDQARGRWSNISRNDVASTAPRKFVQKNWYYIML